MKIREQRLLIVNLIAVLVSIVLWMVVGPTVARAKIFSPPEVTHGLFSGLQLVEQF